ncbi:MAG TPA: PPK2 family polyphosphate kinase [Xanthomonadales bacterium]|nr:PPK2 family polyphosphate kinase [Xanthomonadales bacterium]
MKQPWFQPAIGKAIAATDSTFRIAYDAGLQAAPDTYMPVEQWKDSKDQTRESRKDIRELQQALQASKRFSVLAIFQALDAAGKDGAVREVFKGVNPGGLKVTSFKSPSEQEVEHDFLWRTSKALPRDGEIGIFNRSYYEEVLVVRVHPGYLDSQYAGYPPPVETLWPARYQAIREHELHLAQSNTLVLKFWLNVSPQRQARRFLERLDDPEKRWKFSTGDLREARLRDQYDQAVLQMFNETSRPWAPWFCIPADERWYARWKIAETIKQAMSALPLPYPEGESLSDDQVSEFRAELENRRDS